MSDFVRGLKCRLCGKTYAKEPLNFCTEDFGPLEVDYDYAAIAKSLGETPAALRASEGKLGPTLPEERALFAQVKIGRRDMNMWRYRELLPIDGEPTVGPQVGGTPLVRANRLAAELGVENLWLKNDAVNFPTLSFKDRVVSVALSKAREFGFKTVGCASTGNLANSVAANSAAAGLEAYIFIPADLETTKIIGTSIYGAHVIGVHGTYDQVNRLCTQVAFKYGWGFVNINLRPFYAEGSKSMGFEIAEQLGWRTPRHVVVPMAGGSLIGKIHKAFHELHKVGLIKDPTCKIFGAQATGCNPITNAVKNGWEAHRPVKKPNTIAKSLAIGDPADGYFAAKVMRDTGGWGEDVSDAEIAEAMYLLAKTEGIWAETAGGVTVAGTKKLIEQGRIPRDEEIVICITGNGLKTQDAVNGLLEKPVVIKPSLDEFEPIMEGSREALLV
jgi:threonine synthase